MSQADPQRLVDGVRSLEGGVDSGKGPDVIGPLNPDGLARNQLAWAVNTTVRGGFPTCRPGFVKQTLAPDSELASIQGGRFQGAGYYESRGGCLVAQVEGHLYRLEPDDEGGMQVAAIAVTKSDGSDDPNPTNRPRVWMEQAEGTLVVEDGQSRPILYNGGTARRAADDEVPAGTAMAYGWGRLWVAHGRYFFGCDLFDGTDESVLKRTQNTAAFAVPIQSGDITAMRFIASLDSPTGQGRLLIYTRQGAFAFLVPLDADAWINLPAPIMQVAQFEYGAVSHWSVVTANGDHIYRAPDGFRSLYLATRQFRDSWANTPLGREMFRLLSRDSDTLLQFASGVLFDNRVLVTCDGGSDEGKPFFRSLAVMDLDLISSLRQKSPPAWEGEWSVPDARITQIVKGRFNGVERCFLFALSPSGENEVWELTKTRRFDNAGADDQRIEWQVEYPSLDWQQFPALKRLDSGDLAIDRAEGTVDLSVAYRPDQYPCWFSWCTRQVCAQIEQCDAPAAPCPAELVENQPQYRPRIHFNRPDDAVCEAGTSKPACIGNGFQLRLTVRGAVRAKMLRLYATPEPEDLYGPCVEEEACVAVPCCPK